MTTGLGRRGVIGGLVAAALPAWLAGCASPRPLPAASGGRLEILGPDAAFSLDSLPEDWIIDGNGREARRRTTLVARDGVPSLRIENGRETFVLARRVQAVLLATPFLSWSWNLDAYDGGYHPIQLLVGFRSGDRREGFGSDFFDFGWGGRSLPESDHMLMIAFGESALQRGNLSYPAPRRSSARERRIFAHYVMRGGRENTRSWWLETLDLAQMFARAWPDEDPARAEAVFVGFVAEGERSPTAGHIAGVLLSR